MNVVPEIVSNNHFLWCWYFALIYCTKTEQWLCDCRVRLCQIGGEGLNSCTGWIFLEGLLPISVVTTQTMQKHKLQRWIVGQFDFQTLDFRGYQTHSFYSLVARKKSKRTSETYAQRHSPRNERCAAHVFHCSFSSSLPRLTPFWFFLSPVAPVCSV